MAVEQYAERQPISLGELFTVGATLVTTDYAGPVLALLGQYDFPFCGGNCNYPEDLAAATVRAWYPLSMQSDSKVLPEQGHCLNAHYAAPTAYAQIFDFLKARGV